MSNRAYRKEYQERHDIDWFACYKGVPIHVASNGGEIPREIKSSRNRELQRFIASKEPMLNDDQIVINESWLNKIDAILSDKTTILGNDVFAYKFDKDAYLRTFIDFAKKGFISIDNALIEEAHVYRIVAYPKEKVDLFKLQELPIITKEVNNIDINLWNE